jgi:thioesterase domain-containing protein
MDHGSSRVIPIQSDGSRTPIYFVHDLLGDIDCYRALASTLGPDHPVYALRSFPADLQGLESVEGLASSYLTDLRAFRPGPYILGGFSFGGTLAFEMARQLEEIGEETLLVAMIDAWIAAADCKLRSREQLSILLKKAKDQGFPYLSSKVRNKCIYWAHRMRQSLLHLAGVTFIHLGVKTPTKVRLALLEKANRRILRAYQPRAYRGQVLLAASSHTWEILSRRGNRFYGWDILAGPRFEIQTVDAEHMSIMKEPSVREIAWRIGETLSALDRVATV